MIAPLVYEKKRVGVGFMPGSRLGYMPGARLGYTPGTSLGAISDAMIQNAEADGYQASDLNLLSSVGATDDDITELLNGQISLAQLYANYGVSIPSTSATTAAPAPATTLQLPQGSTFTYVAQWNGAVALAAGLLGKLQAALPPLGLSVLSSNVTGSGVLSSSGIQLSVMDVNGNAQIGDAKSVIDGAIYQIIGAMPGSSAISNVVVPAAGTSIVPSLVAPGSTAVAAAPVTGLAWFENNAGVIAAVVLAAFVLPGIVKKI